MEDINNLQPTEKAMEPSFSALPSTPADSLRASRTWIIYYEWMFAVLHSAFEYPPKWCTCNDNCLWHGWCHARLPPSWRTFCAHHTAMHQFTVLLEAFMCRVQNPSTLKQHQRPQNSPLPHGSSFWWSAYLTCILSMEVKNRWKSFWFSQGSNNV